MSILRHNARYADGYADPFCDALSSEMPVNMQEALRWCDYTYVKVGPYRRALERVLAYFLGEIEVSAAGPNELGSEERREYADYLVDDFGIVPALFDVGLDFMFYGACLFSVMEPIRRSLACPKARCVEYPLRRYLFTPNTGVHLSGETFKGRCLTCGQQVVFRTYNRRDQSKRLTLHRWALKDVDIIHSSIPETNWFLWRIPESINNAVRREDRVVLTSMDWSVLQAAANKQNLLLHDDFVCYIKEPALSGLRLNGWPWPATLSNFHRIWLYQLLNRTNETVALDYLLATRVLSPAPTQSSGQTATGFDPMFGVGGEFRRQALELLAQRAKYPASWGVTDQPLQYQELGGSPDKMIPKDMMESVHEQMLSAIGIPVELHRGSISIQAAPMVLKLLESNFAHLWRGLNLAAKWMGDRIGQLRGWRPIIVRLRPPSHVHDATRQMMLMQLAAAGKVSDDTLLRSAYLDSRSERQQMNEEVRESQQDQLKLQKEQEQMQQAEQMLQAPESEQAAAGGASAGAGVPGSVQELEARAEQIAQQTFTMSEGQKDSFLINLSRQDPTLHALVIRVREQMDNDMKNQGGEMVEQQMFGKAGSAYHELRKHVYTKSGEEQL